ncbi:T9SS type A sorting domain-containing protein [Prolixibacteraceae bacterium Z1-6]|uniref:T9SS type A sorting domain-containing protein n=1 Tax=Draconibacterium aestuarii TaxID=2998507 RepID=A0A9X3FB24_9BACT|nr:T9SS type A sorting domain-containing protein [Prolixibacteraceae bacterium Z1-6]
MKLLQHLLILASLFLAFSSKATIYEAEKAALYKAVTEAKNIGYSGDSYINFDNESGGFANLKVGMAAAGQQKITIRFANGNSSPRPMKIELNDVVITESLDFETTGNWTSWDTLSINSSFNAGVNYLKCTSVGSEGGPNIDLFDITGEQAQTFSLNLSIDGNGQILQLPDNDLLFEGEEISLIAKADFNSIFKNWTGDCTSESDTLNFILNENKTLVAHFLEIELNLPEPEFSIIGYATVSSEGVETTTGGKNGKVTVIESLAQLIAWGARREDNYTAETVIIKGKIEAETSTVITIKRGKDISFLGDSQSSSGFAELQNISLNIRDYSNVIVRNLKIHEVFYPNDDLTIDECHHVWIDHCEFHRKVGPEIGYDTYDGLLDINDIKKGSHNVTVSWCYFHDLMKTVLVGHSDNNGEQDQNLQVTFHHNWFANTDGRNPSLRFGQMHYFNNYLENITDYGFAVRNGAHAKFENCYFESVNLPITTDKFKGHGFACVSGCIYSGSCTETDNEISNPTDCDFWNDQLPYDFLLENTNTVNLSVKAYSGVGKIEIVTSAPKYFLQEEDFNVVNISLNQNRNGFNFTLFSNKTQQLQFALYSIDGKLIARSEVLLEVGQQEVQLETQNRINGIYLVKIAGSNTVYSGKTAFY